MKTIIKKPIFKLVLTVAVLFGTVTSCKKDYFDINEDPNHPADVPVNLLLPSAEAAIAHTLGNDMAVNGGIWAQYWTQSSSASQYKSLEQYNPSATDFDYVWAILYSDALTDLKTIDVKAPVTGQTQYVACSKILQAYAFQLLTDNFDAVPFSEGLRGEEGILQPHYDDQNVIYDGIINLIDQGLALIDDNADATTPGAPGHADIIFDGNMHMWRKFGNTLKLRAYMRLSERDAGKASAGITAMGTPEFLGIGEMAQITYSSVGGNTNPFYAQMVDLGFTTNLVASSTTINYFNSTNDPRISTFYDTTSTGTYAGIPQGDYTNPSPVSLPSAVTGANALQEASATAPVILMSSWESLFLQAEASARGWLVGGVAQTLYEGGIRANFAYYGIADSIATTFIAQPSVAYPGVDPIKTIITQKWAAMCGNQTNEAWTEWRRTGFPDFFTPSVNALISSGMPARYLYPQNEISTNANHRPQASTVTVKVWWDIN